MREVNYCNGQLQMEIKKHIKKSEDLNRSPLQLDTMI